jgi:uncharacterized membrane protein YphA (DoxX/SURF4 family)
MKAKNIFYWITTILIAAFFILGGVMDLKGGPQVTEGMKHLGYASYVATILGVWKLLGALAIVAPRLPVLKEWAYAGIFFDVTGAAASHAFSGDGAKEIASPLIFMVVAMISWALRPPSRKCAPCDNRPTAQQVPYAETAKS